MTAALLLAGALASFEGEAIASVSVDAPAADAARLSGLVELRPGEPLRREAVRHAVELLHATGEFEDVVVEAEYRFGSQEHIYIEPQGMQAEWTDDALVLRGSLQCPYYVVKGIARLLDVSPNVIRVIQQAQVDLKLLREKPDGALGPMTRSAIRAFQRSVAMRETGEPTADVFIALQDAVKTEAARTYTSEPTADSWPSAAGDQVKVIQTLLRDLNFSREAPDGVLGPATRAAIRYYERSLGLAQTGEPSKTLFDSPRRGGSRSRVVVHRRSRRNVRRHRARRRRQDDDDQARLRTPPARRGTDQRPRARSRHAPAPPGRPCRQWGRSRRAGSAT